MLSVAADEYANAERDVQEQRTSKAQYLIAGLRASGCYCGGSNERILRSGTRLLFCLSHFSANKDSLTSLVKTSLIN